MGENPIFKMIFLKVIFMKRAFLSLVILIFIISLSYGEYVMKWTNRYDSGGGDWARGVAVDSSCNIYVAGYYANGVSDDYCIIKYNSSGSALWTNFYDAGNGQDRPHGIAVDLSGNVYVIGDVRVTNEWMNIWIRKYDSAGNVIWTRTHNGNANGSDYGNGITVDTKGNVYAIGNTTITGESYNIWVQKYNSAGNAIWTRTHNDVTNNLDYGNGIAVDTSGNVYVVGGEYTTGESQNIWIRKYSGGKTISAPPLSTPDDSDSIEDFFIYPNVLSGTTKFKVKKLRGDISVKVYNRIGVVLKKADLTVNNNELDISDLNLSTGMYIVVVRDKASDESKILKFMFVK